MACGIARALFDYSAENVDELTFKRGDLITIIETHMEDSGWWKGEFKGKIGLFPDNFVEIVTESFVQQVKFFIFYSRIALR